MKVHLSKLALAAFLAGAAACGPTQSNTPATAAQPVLAQKSLFAVYMVGSDIEDDIQPRNGRPDEQEQGGQSSVGAGSSDIKEMLEAWTALPPTLRQNLDVVVALGGARKAGWQGVKYADLPCLQQDLQDDYVGNADCYLYRDDAEMSNQASLSRFLNYLKDEYAEHDRRIFQFWNHGLAYLGVGYDTTARRSHDYITLPEMRASFEETQSQFDLVGFDACLMASLEVAQAVAPYSRYMLASEDLEPGHGWQYSDVVSLLGHGRHLEIPELGRQLVDSFLDHPHHQNAASQNKTLSLLDLEKNDAVVSALNQLVEALDVENFQSLLSALEESQRFGEEPRNNLDYSIDLLDWLNQLEGRQSPLKAQIETARQALMNMVLYARHDATVPGSNGLSIYSLNARMKTNYGREQSVSETWLNFASRFISRGSSDAVAPSIGSFRTQQAVEKRCTSATGQSGHCFEISDNLGLKSVEQIYGLQASERYIFQIGSESLQPRSDLDGRYFAPVWNGEWLLLCNGSCQSGLSVFPPAYFSHLSERQTRIYTAEAQLNGQDVVFYIEMGQNNAVVNAWAVPYELGTQGELILARQILELQTGDALRFYFRVNDVQTGELRWQAGETLSFTQTPRWDFARIDAPRRYFVQATDYRGNLSVSDLYAVE